MKRTIDLKNDTCEAWLAFGHLMRIHPRCPVSEACTLERRPWADLDMLEILLSLLIFLRRLSNTLEPL